MDWKPRDLVRIKPTGDKGRVLEVLPDGRYRVVEMAEAWDKGPLGEEPAPYRELGHFTADQLEVLEP